eukprot:6187992-Pleurochrysis_carterae.AAC.3
MHIRTRTHTRTQRTAATHSLIPRAFAHTYKHSAYASTDRACEKNANTQSKEELGEEGGKGRQERFCRCDRNGGIDAGRSRADHRGAVNRHSEWGEGRGHVRKNCAQCRREPRKRDIWFKQVAQRKKGLLSWCHQPTQSRHASLLRELQTAHTGHFLSPVATHRRRLASGCPAMTRRKGVSGERERWGGGHRGGGRRDGGGGEGG